MPAIAWKQLGEDEYTSELGRLVRDDVDKTWFYHPAEGLIECKPGQAARSGPYDSPKSAAQHAEHLCGALLKRKETANVPA